ncbi:peptidoglycan-binding protein [Streptomyces sp. NBC_00525]|uniref:peptidoglycan-binding protein n=1 Tax=Streptomyces sp. NBC_00525 TaxID=2903660 RepID=UPI002E80FFED|nr:peptidoglycan-binding protein [Streptomyces sp. NBC_00525]WUC93786.1 peptidoglycan-binding protein [Streptomyces sp. NBC_00525]
MTVPAFEEYVPATDCPCPGCAAQRRTAAGGLPTRYGGNPAAHGARRAMVLVTAAGVVLGGGIAESFGAPADPAPVPGTGVPAGLSPFPDSPQGMPGPLRGTGSPGAEAPGADAPGTGASGAADAGAAETGTSLSSPAAPVLPATTRTEIINRAKKWVAAKVPYSMSTYWTDGYRQDCSGYVSMAWNLPGNEWTGSLAAYGTRIAREDLQPGDILLFHNLADPAQGSHVTIFGGWTDHTHTHYTAYEQTKPSTRKQTTPMAYWTNSASYVAYRYKGLATGNSGSEATTAPFPGATKFGPGTNNTQVTRLGTMLVGRGGRRFYKVGPGPLWTAADRNATRAFQRAQGWKGAEADGIPGPDTWQRLVTGTGRDIPAAGGQSGSKAVPAFPGRGYFRPGQVSGHVENLGKQLVKKGYGAHYRSGPDPRWTEADRRNVEAFQKAQGWRGREADGYPGPETWRRLFA